MKSLKDGAYQYREIDFLGEGSFAKVYKGVIVKTQRVIAVRLLSLKLIKQFGNKIKSIIRNTWLM
jgi:serine/threonine protein kinase